MEGQAPDPGAADRDIHSRHPRAWTLLAEAAQASGGETGRPALPALVAGPVDRGGKGMVAMSGGTGPGFGDVGGRAAGAVIGTMLGNALLSHRLRRLAREATRYLEPGENLAAPIPYCYQGGRRARATGVAIVVVAILVGVVCSAIFHIHNDGLIGAVAWGIGAGLLVIWVAVILAKKYAIVVTDRRLVLFRAKRRIPLRLREIQATAPRGQVSMSVRMRIDGPEVRLSFAPATGIPPILLHGGNPAALQAVQEALIAGHTRQRQHAPTQLGHLPQAGAPSRAQRDAGNLRCAAHDPATISVRLPAGPQVPHERCPSRARSGRCIRGRAVTHGKTSP